MIVILSYPQLWMKLWISISALHAYYTAEPQQLQQGVAQVFTREPKRAAGSFTLKIAFCGGLSDRKKK